MFLTFFWCGCVFGGKCKWFCLPWCVWFNSVWVVMAISLRVDYIWIVERAFGGSLRGVLYRFLMRCGIWVSGLALMGDSIVGMLLGLRLKGDNLVGILWVLLLVGDSLVARLWDWTFMDEHYDVCRHTRQWCLWTSILIKSSILRLRVCVVVFFFPHALFRSKISLFF